MTGRRGFTLVEALVAASLAAVLLGAAAVAFGAGTRLGERIGERLHDAQRRTLALGLLRHEIETAGRGEETGGLRFELDARGEGGDRIFVRYLAEADRAEPVQVDAAFDARRDGRGRWNLYRTPAGSVRQPWLLDVSGLHLLEGVRVGGTRIERAALPDAGDLIAVRFEVRFADGTAAGAWASTERSTDPRAGTVLEGEP